MKLVNWLFSTDGFMPHGHCYLWNPSMVRLHVLSDALIAAAYFCIPIALVTVISKRRDLPFGGIFWCFATFIIACGGTHLMEIWNIWHPTYWLSGFLKAVTAAASVTTAALLVKMIPHLLAMPTAGQITQVENENVELRRVQESLALSQKMMQTIVDHLPQRVFWKDPQSVYLGCNKAAATDAGLTEPSEIAGLTDFDLQWKASAHLYREDDAEVIRAGVAKFHYAEPMELPDGTMMWLRTSKVPLYQPDGQVFAILGTYEDVTVVKNAEDALQESEERFRSAFEFTGIGMALVSLEGRWLKVNRTLCDIVGYAEAELLQTTFQKITHPEDLDTDLGHLHRLVAGECRSYQMIKRYLRRDESVVTVHLTVSIVRKASGTPLYFVSQIEDITERRRAEAELAYERDLLMTLLENSPDHIYFKDLDSRYLKCGRALSQRVHLDSPVELIGKSDFDFFHEEHAREALEDEREIIRTGKPMLGKVEKEFWKDSGITSWVLTTKVPFRDKAGDIIGTFGISKDITALKEAETRLETVHKQLVQTSRQAGMAEVATNVLHNVGNVLNSVNVSCSVIAEKVRKSHIVSVARTAELLRTSAGDLATFFSSDPAGRKLPEYLAKLAARLSKEQAAILAELQTLVRNVEHIKDIVAMQQSFGKVSGILETLKATELLEHSLRMNGGDLIDSGIQLTRDYADDPVVQIDKHKAIQILLNLIRNATNACGESERTEKQITVGLRASETAFRVTVTDNGVGIPRENLTRIFSHGFTTRKNGHGFGLHSGVLAAQEMGGSLSVQSGGTGLGATFTLELPLTHNTSQS